MTSSGNVTGVVTKTEPNSSFSSEGSVSHISTLKQHSSESEIIRNNSQESIEEERHTQQSAPTRTHVGLVSKIYLIAKHKNKWKLSRQFFENLNDFSIIIVSKYFLIKS